MSDKRKARRDGVRAVLVDVLESLSTPIFIVDSELTIRFSNQAADRLLGEPEGLYVADGRLAFRRFATGQRFRSLCATTISDVQQTKKPVRRALRVSAGSRRADFALLVHARPPWLEMDGERPTVLVVVADLARRADATNILSELNGFTRSESAVVQRLLHGERLGEIAQALRMAPETARAHVKHAFRKCGVHSQPQLVQLVAMQSFTLLPFSGME